MPASRRKKSENGNGVRITTREIYDEQQRTTRALIDLTTVVQDVKTKTDSVDARVAKIEGIGPESIAKVVVDLETRTKALETRVYGALAVVVAALVGFSKTGVI